MEEENKLPVVMECPGSYVLKDQDEQVISQGASYFLLDAEKLSVLPESGEILLVPYRDVIQTSKNNYKFEIEIVSKEKLTLFNLGYKFEDFSRNFNNLNNEVTLKDLLMNEPLLKSGVEADFRYVDENRIEKNHGQCELRIYETGMVIITEDGNITRIPYGDLSNIRVEDYRLVVSTEYGEIYSFSKMGQELDKCNKIMNEALNKLATKTQMSLKELLPAYDSSTIRKIARLMKEGRAARRMDIEAVSQGSWSELEKKLEEFGIKEEYEYLKSISQAERMCIGVKKGLMGDLTSGYIWFLAPIFSDQPSQPGNAIAMEATSADGSGRATYFFKIVEPEQYAKYNNSEELKAEVDKALKRISRHLLSVNFRREPIYLTDQQLSSPDYISYQRAVAKIPSLQELRRLFIGRVIHHSPEQWRAAVAQLLESNMKTG
jgi:hypothetical protein